MDPRATTFDASEAAWWVGRAAVSLALAGMLLRLGDMAIDAIPFSPQLIGFSALILGLWWAMRRALQRRLAAKRNPFSDRALVLVDLLQCLGIAGLMALSMWKSSDSLKGFIAGLAIPAVMYLLEGARTVQQAHRLRSQAVDSALRAKLAPHFIFNTLATLRAQIAVDPGGAERTAERLAELFRRVLAAADLPLVPLREELEFVEAYLGIERTRFGERLGVVIDVPEALEACEVPPLSLQVLVENAVKHGLSSSEQGGEIRIAARREGADLVLDVSDPGTGPGAQPGTGTALETLRARLAKPGDLTLERREGRTVASFRWRSA